MMAGKQPVVYRELTNTDTKETLSKRMVEFAALLRVV